MPEKIDAWWFAAGTRLPHGDGRRIVVGKKHSKRGDIVICAHALHASRDPFDALRYAPGPYLYKVRCWGDVVEDKGKLGARHREYLAMRDAREILSRFAREQALSVILLWNAPDTVRRYLETGDESLQIGALSLAWSATQGVFWNPVQDAAWTAALSAAYAARVAAARAAAWTSAWTAARSAAKAVAQSTAQSAVWGAAQHAAQRAAWGRARKRFNELVLELFQG